MRVPYYEFEQVKPVVHPASYVHPSAVVIGDVWIDENCYVGPLASLRGDFGRIRVMAGCNVQDCCVMHGFPDHEIVLENDAHIGHGAVIHTAVIRRNALVGINSVVLDYAEVGEDAIVAANSTVPAHCKVPKRTLFAGSPGTVRRQLTEENLAAKSAGTQVYQQLARRCLAGMQETQPLEQGDLARAKIDWELTFNATFETTKK